MLIGIAGKKRSGKDTVANILAMCYKITDYDRIDNTIRRTITNDDINYIITTLQLYDKEIDIIDRSVICSFAYKLKQIVGIICSISEKEVMSDDIKDTLLPNYIKCPIGRTYRHLFQYVGTEIGRKMLGNDVWVESTIKECIDIEEKYGVAIISDVRFENEQTAISNKNGAIIMVYGKDDNADTDGHESESLNNIRYGYTIDNKGTIKELVLQVVFIFNTLIVK